MCKQQQNKCIVYDESLIALRQVGQFKGYFGYLRIPFSLLFSSGKYEARGGGVLYAILELTSFVSHYFHDT